MTERKPTTLYEAAQNDPGILRAAFEEVDEANRILLSRLPSLPPNDRIYSRLMGSDDDLGSLLVKGSGVHSLHATDPKAADMWKNMRQFMDAVDFKGNRVDIGSGNGLLTAMIQEAYPDSVPYGVGRSELGVRVVQLLFPGQANHFVHADMLETTAQTPQELSPHFPETFDTTYWSVWSRQGNFSDPSRSKMTRQLGRLASWTTPTGKLVLGFYDKGRDEEHKSDLDLLGIEPDDEIKNTRGYGGESLWVLTPAAVLGAIRKHSGR